jgi:hypothetical protein
MEDLTRLVADSLARHGFAVAVDHRRLEWSRWFRCESSFSLLLVPSAAGLYAVGEEIIAPGELPAASGKRLLAVFQVAETEDLCVALSRLFAPRNPLSERLSQGRCFVRFAVVADPHQRQAACESLNRWLTSSAEIANGTGKEFSKDFTLADDAQPEIVFPSAEKQGEVSTGAPDSEPPPLPAGF